MELIDEQTPESLPVYVFVQGVYSHTLWAERDPDWDQE